MKPRKNPSPWASGPANPADERGCSQSLWFGKAIWLYSLFNISILYSLKGGCICLQGEDKPCPRSSQALASAVFYLPDFFSSTQPCSCRSAHLKTAVCWSVTIIVQLFANVSFPDMHKKRPAKRVTRQYLMTPRGWGKRSYQLEGESIKQWK